MMQKTSSLPLVWITGGTRGLGATIAHALARTNEVSLSYRSDVKNAEVTRNSIYEDTGREALLLRGDISKDEVAQKHVQQIKERFGQLNALVHCVALATFKPVLKLKSRELRKTLAYSFESFHNAVCAAAESIIEVQGQIITISSLGARRTIQGYGALGASKAAMEAYCRHLAVELAEHKVQVNIICPGLLETSSLKKLGINATKLDYVKGRTPIGRLINTGEVADVVETIIQSRFSAITGQRIVIDGGYEIVG